MLNSSFKPLAKTLLLICLFVVLQLPVSGFAQTVTHVVPYDRTPQSCLRFKPEVECDKNGVISVILHAINPAGFSPDELEVTSLTPGVTVQPNYMSPVPPQPSFVLNGATIGQEITLMSNAVDIGAGAIQGSDLCCAGTFTFRIPRGICKRPDPDLEVKKSRGACRAWSNGNGHSCTFQVSVTNVGSGQFTGPLSITDTYTAPSANVSNPSPPWVCTNFPATNSFTCTHPVTTVSPGQTVWLNYTLNVGGYIRGGRFQNCAELRPDDTTRGQVARAQALLNDAGYSAGTVDGVAGARTRAAVLACQSDNGQPLTGDYRDFLGFIASQSSVDAFLGNNRSCVNVDLKAIPQTVKPKTCPKGTVGIYPNCRKIIRKTCPSATVGTFPNCKRVVVRKCPKGTIGDWPICVKIKLR